MPIIDSNQYKPSVLFRNGHVNTLYPYLFRKNKSFPFKRQRYLTPDEDFFDVDWLENEVNSKLVILLHGLEGSSSSQYINGMTNILCQNGYNIAAINFRSCSGEMNLQCEMYHSGFTKDLHHFIDVATDKYTQIFICGFSLGGNVTLKYISDGVYSITSKIKAVAGISVPCDLKGGSIMLKKWYNHLYEQRFLATLLKKVRFKQTLLPNKIDLSNIHRVKTLWDFDEYYTSSLHGFQGAEDYYKQCSSLPFLPNIAIPAIMINALDDSFLAKTSYPYQIANDHPHFHLVTPKNGGHVGFSDFNSQTYWSEKHVLAFFNQF